MSKEFPKRLRRYGVIINYISVVLFSVVFLLGEYGTWNIILGCFSLVFLSVVVISFTRAYIKTGIWKLTQSKAQQLDEREINVIYDSYRRAYGIFTAISVGLVILITFSVRFSFFTLTHRGHYSFGLLAIVLLSYLVNTLPAAIIAWSEPRIEV